MTPESIILDRPDVHLTAIFDGRVYSFSDTLRLTTTKMTMRDFEIPLIDIVEEAYHQPIFGSNYLTGKHSLPNAMLANRVEWKFTFHHGTGTFLHAFFAALENARGDASARNSMKNVVFVDPHDPSVLYVPH